MKRVPLTITPRLKADYEFAQKVADNINKDFNGAAVVDKGICYVTEKYYDRQKKPLLKNCQIRG